MKKGLFRTILSWILVLSMIIPSSLVTAFAAETEETTTIYHTQTTGDSNYFTYSESGWSAMGQSSEHVWSDTPSASDPSAIWYEVKFVGHKIDIYAGKNHPMGNVKYYMDGEVVGTFSLYNGSNINSTYITTIDGLEEGEHTFRAEATEAKLIDCAEVIVYHAPYTANSITLEATEITLAEGATKQIKYTVSPSYAVLSDAVYTSSDKSVVTVDENGLITAEGAGSATIKIESAASDITATVKVTVTASVAGISGSIVDTDTQWTQDRYDEVKSMGEVSASLTAWKNDKAVSELALVSVDSALKNVTVTASDFKHGSDVIKAENVTATFIKSTKAYNGSYLGYGSTTREVPADNGTNRSESSDILYQTTPIDIAYNSVQPVWVEIAVPADAKAGTYTGTVSVTADDLEGALEFTYSLTVQDASLPDSTEFTDSFDIMLWQYPYSSAEYYGVEAFSDEHFEILESSMEIYKEVGGNAITATILEEAWSGQTYSANEIHYPSMVKWTKNSDGSFNYDYTDFDKWITFCRDMGLGDKIVLYSIAPWHGSFTYWENDELVYETYTVGSTRYTEVWTDFLRNLIDHLMEKGWFEYAYIGIDERGFDSRAFDLIESVRNIHDQCLKTASDMDSFVNKWDMALRITDLNVGDTAAAANPAKFAELIEAREAKGYRTTLYSCTEHQPGQFSLSAPVESYWAVLNAGKMDGAGFNRWAYDAWVADPLNDTTHNAFEAGDCFLIFPDEKDAENPTSKMSVRLARMAEGIRDVNKLRLMEEEIPSLAEKIDAVYDNIQYSLTTSRSYMSDANIQTLSNETAGFKAALAALTEEYIALKAAGTDEVESISIAEGASATLCIGDVLQLHAEFMPENLLNTNVTWTSSNANVAAVDKNGQVTALQTGTAVITAKSAADVTKSAKITISVNALEIDDAKKVSYYSFDNVTGTKLVDEWGDRDGVIAGGIEAGKSGNALSVTEAGVGATIDGTLNTLDTDWTIGYWVKTTSDFDKEISVLEDAAKEYSFSLKMASDRASGFRVGDGSGDVLTFSYDYQKDTWYHITWVQDKDTGLSLYVNGTLVTSNTWPVNNTVKAPIDVIGGTGFTGLIDEVKIYNAPLTAAEVIASMQVEGINLSESSIEMWVGDTYTINANVVSNAEDKTITYSSDNEAVATVSEDGVITAHKKGTAVITLKCGEYEAAITVTAKKYLTISNTLPVYMLDQKYVTDIDKPTDTSNQYLGQPDMVRTSTGRLITAYPQGHGKGPLIMQISDDNGETWTKKTDIPESWAGSQETPTMYVLNLADGTERIMLITACPGWGTDSDGNQYGWNTSYSDDNGETWTEYAHWHSTIGESDANDCIVAMASLIQLKDENGNYIDEWMGVFHNYSYQNYKTILSFDENGNEQWSEPELYLDEYRSIESTYQICEVGLFRSPDGSRIVGLARSQSHNNPSTLIYSDDEGKTWSEPMDLPGTLSGERHKAVYDPISGRLVITFREIFFDLDGDNEFGGSSDWTCGDWGVWVGTYEDLMNQEEGDYRIRIAEDWANNAKSGDTGYAGLLVLEDGTFIMDSYGHWDKDYSLSWTGGVTTDLCYIKQAKFKLADVENGNGLVDYSALEEAIAKELPDYAFSTENMAAYEAALEEANAMVEAKNVQQVEVDAMTEVLTAAYDALMAEIAFENPFEDVTEDQYWYDAVMWAASDSVGVTDGTSDTTFSPWANCTRGHVVTFLYRAMGCPEITNKENPFVDVKEDAFYYDAVLWAVENGITDGTSATTFDPNAECTRGQIVTFLYRNAGKPQVDTTVNPFTDVAADSYYLTSILWAVENGITDGTSETTFAPGVICNRGTAVTFLYRTLAS